MIVPDDNLGRAGVKARAGGGIGFARCLQSRKLQIAGIIQTTAWSPDHAGWSLAVHTDIIFHSAVTCLPVAVGCLLFRHPGGGVLLNSRSGTQLFQTV